MARNGTAGDGLDDLGEWLKLFDERDGFGYQLGGDVGMRHEDAVEEKIVAPLESSANVIGNGFFRLAAIFFADFHRTVYDLDLGAKL